jgi:predicted ATPase
MTKPIPLQSFRLKNFKAVRDSGIIKFGPLTVFIGDNGSGKSSIIEGLETLQAIVTYDLDTAMLPWRNFRDILNKAVPHKVVAASSGNRAHHTNPTSLDLRGQLGDRMSVKYSLEVSDGPSGNDLFIKQEALSQKGRNVPLVNVSRDASGHATGICETDEHVVGVDAKLQDGTSLLNLSKADFPFDIPLRTFIRDWQFVSLVAQSMGYPRPQKRTGGPIILEKDGSNVAEYLLAIRNLNPNAFGEILSSLQIILPYASDLQIALTSELERAVYLLLTETEENFKVPGWLLSTGTLRILALLALLHHPSPPPLIIIEEIENGLDPQSVYMIIHEIRRAIEDSKTQIIMTTHSPYLLNLLHIDHIVLVERVEGQPVFRRPGDDEKLRQWSESFGLGGLYTGGKLSGGA